jgi:ssDNA-binding Zn-finger/Zn-ribbon topoisomerase 1
MIGESRSRCTGCGSCLDPTVAFQRCPECGGQLRLRIRRYRCVRCGADVHSRFVFDGRVFDAAYYRKAMAESRRRRHEQRALAASTVRDNRSESLQPPVLDLASIPGLLVALDGLAGSARAEMLAPLCDDFDLKRYERHVQAHIGPIAVCFEEIPVLGENARKDRIWRFVAIIFLAHAGLIEVHQEEGTIWVSKHVDRERQGIHG